MNGRKGEPKSKRVISIEDKDEDLVDLKQKRIIQNTPDGVKYLNEIKIQRNQKQGRHCHSQSIDDQSNGTIRRDELTQGTQSKKKDRNDDANDDDRQAMKDLQIKLDAVPDVYEDRTGDMFERSNNQSSRSDDGRNV